jgi:uroporphyrinogen decarboxylase
MCAMTSAQRVFTTLSHQEPDQVPLALNLVLRGARELGLGIREYFADPAHVVEAQLRLQQRFGSDVLFGFFHAAVEYEAWGGEVVFTEDGPPNSGAPVLGPGQPLSSLRMPALAASKGLLGVLQAIQAMKVRVGDEVPILGVALSPFSFPVMQLGFDRYIELLLGDRAEFWKLMEQNIAFCQAWANAQLAAGASAIVYFDPLASPTLVPRSLYQDTGFQVAQRTFAGLQGPTVTLLASGRSLGVLDDLAATGTLGVGVSCDEDLAQVKAACRGRLSLIGNLNGLDMVDWTPAQAEAKVKEALAQAGPAGGFILCDNHGEIPWLVPDDTLLAVSEAVRTWGRYPLAWAEAHA